MALLLVLAVVPIGLDLLLRVVERGIINGSGGGQAAVPTGSASVTDPGHAADAEPVPTIQPEEPWVEEDADPGLTARGVVLPLTVLVLWFVVTNVGIVDSFFLASPQDVAELFTRGRNIGSGARDPITETLLRTGWVTVRAVLSGLLFGGIGGLLVVLGLSRSGQARDLLKSSLGVVRPIPLYVLIPVFLLWFGLGSPAVGAVVATGVFVVIVVHMSEALDGMSEADTGTSPATGASRVRIQADLGIPALVPHMLAAFRLAVATAWSLSVAVEMMVAGMALPLIPGLAYLAFVSIFKFAHATVLLITILYAAMAILSDYLLSRLAKRYEQLTTPRPAG